MFQLASRVLLPSTKEVNTKLSRSHDLMLRSNLIRQSSSGIYSLLPLGVRVLNKLKNIVKEELDMIGGQEVELPTLQAKSLWDKSGRWEVYGAELYKLQDRKRHQYCLGPTCEEEVTNLASSLITSSSQLPLMLYQFGKKFRDELRPRAGLLRAREFLMKDLYTFDSTNEGAADSYTKVKAAYHKIFKRIGLPYVVAEADPGSIGGSLTHEFHFLSSAGEDTVLNCNHCGYTANEEQSISIPAKSQVKLPSSLEPEQQQLIDLAQDLFSERGFPSLNNVEDLNPQLFSVIDTPNQCLIVILSGSQKLNLTKLGNLYSSKLKPVDLKYLNTIDDPQLDVIIDKNLEATEATSSSDPKINKIYDGLNSDKEVYKPNDGCALKTSRGQIKFHDIHLSQPGDLCIKCGTNSSDKVLKSHNAIEVAHTFLLGRKYSDHFNLSCTVHNKPVPIHMGCYGIGVSRIIAAVVENTQDDKGLRWPISIAPYRIAILPLFPLRGDNATRFSDALTQLHSQFLTLDPTLPRDVLVDNRNVSPGQRLNEMDFLGIPVSIRLGREFTSNNKVELHHRYTNQTELVPIEEVSHHLQTLKTPDLD